LATTRVYGNYALNLINSRPKLAPKGSPFQDFVIRHEDGFPGFVNLLGIESPGLTSALAIAEEVDSLLK
jgi:2-hydroxyglutarate dehydrogenase